MPRNKCSEETIQKILDVSCHLFMEKGYDHTTIQDIVNALGMSKGAVYHHFKSKEDILDKINDRYYDTIDWFNDILQDSDLTGLEQLRKMLLLQLTDKRKLKLDNLTRAIVINPQLLSLIVNSCLTHAAPFMQTIIEKGVQDGSIHTDNPKELAEVFLFLINIWIGTFTKTPEDFRIKLLFLKEITDKMGLPVISDEVLAVAEKYYTKVMS